MDDALVQGDDELPGDDKDWTWVLERPCPECGLDPRAVDLWDIPELVLANAAGWRGVLTAADVRRRPRPAVWSPLEYACHVRDVFRLFDLRLGLMLAEDDPLFANWDQDRTAVRERYREQDPVTVAAELQEAAEAVAASFAAVEPDQLGRRGAAATGPCSPSSRWGGTSSTTRCTTCTT